MLCESLCAKLTVPKNTKRCCHIGITWAFSSSRPTMQGTANWMSQMGQQNGVGQAPNGMAHDRAMLALQQMQRQQQQTQAQVEGQQHLNQNPSLASPFNPNLVPSQPTPIPRLEPTPQQQLQNQQMLAFLQQQRQQTSPHPPSTGGSIGGMGAGAGMSSPKPPMMAAPASG